MRSPRLIILFLGVLLWPAPTVVAKESSYFLRQRATHARDGEALRAIEFLEKRALLAPCSVEGFFLKDKRVFVSGLLSRYFGYHDTDTQRDNLNRMGVDVLGTLHPRLDFIIVGENSPPQELKGALNLGIPMIDEGEVYLEFKKYFTGAKENTLLDRFKKAKQMARSLTEQMGRDLYYQGTYKFKLNEFLRDVTVDIENDAGDSWSFIGRVHRAGQPGTVSIRIHKETLEVLATSRG